MRDASGRPIVFYIYNVLINNSKEVEALLIFLQGQVYHK